MSLSCFSSQQAASEAHDTTISDLETHMKFLEAELQLSNLRPKNLPLFTLIESADNTLQLAKAFVEVG